MLIDSLSLLSIDLLTNSHNSQSKILVILQFEIPYETDHLVTVEVYRNKVGREDECISALRFKTRNGLVSEMYGVASGEMHSLTGHKIVGFFGRSGVKSLHSIGVRVSYPPIPEFQGEWVEVKY